MNSHHSSTYGNGSAIDPSQLSTQESRSDRMRQPYTEVPLRSVHRNPHWSCTLRVEGIKAPYIYELAPHRDPQTGKLSRSPIKVDRHDEHVLAPSYPSGTLSFELDFPGQVDTKPYRFEIPSRRGNGSPITRQWLAERVAREVIFAVTETKRCNEYGMVGKYASIYYPDGTTWDLGRVKYKSLRLVGLNYYDNHWVPVLALS